jgi:hypothetical protein
MQQVQPEMLIDTAEGTKQKTLTTNRNVKVQNGTKSFTQQGLLN